MSRAAGFSLHLSSIATAAGVLVVGTLCAGAASAQQDAGSCPAGCVEADAAAPPAEAAPEPTADVRDLIFRNIIDRAYPSLASKWPQSSIAVCWENATTANAADREIIKRAALDTWDRHSALSFTGWTDCVANNRGIRILIQDSGPRTQGLGTRINGVRNGMILNTTFSQWGTTCGTSETMRKSCIYTIAVHEFGHAIGFAHEQNRPDTPDDECLERAQGSQGDTLLTPWDIHSVMNYCNPIYNNNGTLSEFDIFGVQHVYGMP